jgi:Kazal-type serine protease inhibitor domain
MKSKSVWIKFAVFGVALAVFIIFAAPQCPTVCLTDRACNADSFCARALGACTGFGFCVVMPEACIDVWDPVCGCDGQTYGNWCEAFAVGANISTEGECLPGCVDNTDCLVSEFCSKLEGDCGGTGECLERPLACYEIYAPVCGCDEVTYTNDCYAAAGGSAIDYYGPCIVSSDSGCKANKSGAALWPESVEFDYANGVLTVSHINGMFNCCYESIDVSAAITGFTIDLYEQEYTPNPCYCECPIDVFTEIPSLMPGAYTVNIYVNGDFAIDGQTTVP